MTVREFGADSFIDHSVGTGGMAVLLQGAFTVVAIAKRISGNDGNMGAVLNVETAGSNRGTFRYNDNSPNQQMNYLRGEFDSPGDGPNWNIADGWVLVAWTKSASDPSVVRYHKCVLSSDTWTHQDSSGDVDLDDNTATLISTRFSADTSRRFQGRIAARAVWNVNLGGPTPSNVDAAIEALRDSYSDWLAATPIFANRFDQASTTTAVDDDAGNGANQTSLAGSTVITDDDPPGWSFTGGETIDVEPATLTLVGQSTTPVPGVVDISLTPATVVVSPVSSTVVPGVVTVSLVPIVLELQPLETLPLSAGSVVLTPAIVTVVGQSLGAIPGEVTITLGIAQVQIMPLDIGQIGAEVDITVLVGASRADGMQIGTSRNNSVEVSLSRTERNP